MSSQASSWVPYEQPPDITAAGYYVGTSGYYFDDWVGLFNPPPNWRPRCEVESSWHNRLAFYQRYFSFVEINTTFYRLPSVEFFAEIEHRSKPQMQYTVKVFRDISHTKEYDAQRGRELMRSHIAVVAPLIGTGRLYSLLIQLEDHIMRNLKRLDYLLYVGTEAVRNGIDVHIEFRHTSWHIEHVLRSLKNAGIGICNTEIPPLPHAFPLKSYATSNKGYIRYSGRNLLDWYPRRVGRREGLQNRLAERNSRYNYLYTDEELEERVIMQEKLRGKVSSVAIAFNNHYKTKAILNAIDNIKKLHRRLHRGDALPKNI